jgi:hypothetical protein
MSIENLKTFGKFATFPLPARVGHQPIFIHSHAFVHSRRDLEMHLLPG